jgi:hypothetical protein
MSNNNDFWTLSADLFNRLCPIGTVVEYYPVKSQDDFELAHTTTEARDMYGNQVVGLDIGPSCYSLSNMKVIGYYLNVADEDGFAVKKIPSELNVGERIISEDEYKKIVGEDV